nr:MAG TPA: hypothetical protein [Caudoviricetes sp.]
MLVFIGTNTVGLFFVLIFKYPVAFNLNKLYNVIKIKVTY